MLIERYDKYVERFPIALAEMEEALRNGNNIKFLQLSNMWSKKANEIAQGFKALINSVRNAIDKTKNI